jgi:hypothetical protein
MPVSHHRMPVSHLNLTSRDAKHTKMEGGGGSYPKPRARVLAPDLACRARSWLTKEKGAAAAKCVLCPAP